MNIAENRDCVDAMKSFPDKFFDLAVVDPPYGNAGNDWGEERGRFGGLFDRYRIDRTGRSWSKKYGKKISEWDKAPTKEYFDELFRVSKNQIIWGGNYFSLPPTRCFIVWDKMNISEDFSMAMAEYAWTSFFENAKLYRQTPQGTLSEQRIHPTQKPVDLYRWIFSRYAKPGQKIIDTHLGSGSSRIAAYDCGLDFYGYEIDKQYFDAQEKRFVEYTRQLRFDI